VASKPCSSYGPARFVNLGSDVEVSIATGPVKEALLEAARQPDADALIRRSPEPGSSGRLGDLTFAMVRDSPFAVLRV
jgi:hypothetical protein